MMMMKMIMIIMVIMVVTVVSPTAQNGNIGDGVNVFLLNLKLKSILNVK